GESEARLTQQIGCLGNDIRAHIELLAHSRAHDLDRHQESEAQVTQPSTPTSVSTHFSAAVQLGLNTDTAEWPTPHAPVGASSSYTPGLTVSPVTSLPVTNTEAAVVVTQPMRTGHVHRSADFNSSSSPY